MNGGQNLFGPAVLAIVFGFESGWLGYKYALVMAIHFFHFRPTWNNAIGLLLVLSAGLGTVVYSVTAGEIPKGSALSYLPAFYIGSVLLGGALYQARLVYLANKSR